MTPKVCKYESSSFELEKAFDVSTFNNFFFFFDMSANENLDNKSNCKYIFVMHCSMACHYYSLGPRDISSLCHISKNIDFRSLCLVSYANLDHRLFKGCSNSAILSMHFEIWHELRTRWQQSPNENYLMKLRFRREWLSDVKPSVRIRGSKPAQHESGGNIEEGMTRVETFLILFHFYPWPLSLYVVLSPCKCCGQFWNDFK